MILEVLLGNAFHSIHLHCRVIACRNGIRNLLQWFLMNLHAVDGEARACVEASVADVALEVFRLLVLDQDLLIVKLSVAVPTPWFHRLLLFTSHFFLRSSLINMESKFVNR